MKRLILLYLSFFIFNSFILAQEIINNPEKPLNKNAGRVAELREVMQIKDVGGDFYFKYPRNLKIAPNGSIFIVDDEQLLQFDRRGKFVHNFFKKGQGPGEMFFIWNYSFDKNNIIIHNSNPPKIIWFDFNGSIIKEFRIYKGPASLKFLALYNNMYYFLSSDFPDIKGQSAVVDVPQNLISITFDEQEIKNLKSFSTKTYVKVGKQGGRVFCPINSLTAVTFQKKFIFISHTQEYLIKLYDLEKNQVTLQFRRQYKRIKTPRGEEKKCGAMVDGKPVILPRQIYMDDIQNLFVSNGQLWVMTSKTDNEKRVLIDVFNFEGQYIDNFYLKFPENFAREIYGHKPMVVTGYFLYSIEQDEEGTYVIRKYKIEDINN